MTQLAPLSAGMMDRLPKLKFVAVSRGGPVNIDMKAARERGITVVNTPGRNASAVAEFTIGAILAETRNITRGHDALRRGEWRGDLYRADLTGEELSEMTVGLIGYGEVGRRVVQASQGLRLPHSGRRSLCPALGRRPARRRDPELARPRSGRVGCGLAASARHAGNDEDDERASTSRR